MKTLKKSLLSLLIMLSLGLTALSVKAQVGGEQILADNYGMPFGSIFDIILSLLNWLLGLLGIFGILGFVISGILYLTSAGDEGQIDKAKTAMLWSIVGVLVGLSGFVIIQAVMKLLGGTDNRF